MCTIHKVEMLERRSYRIFYFITTVSRRPMHMGCFACCLPDGHPYDYVKFFSASQDTSSTLHMSNMHGYLDSEECLHEIPCMLRSPFAGPLPTESLTGGQVDSSDPTWLAAELAPGRPSRASAFQEIDLNSAAGAVRLQARV